MLTYLLESVLLLDCEESSIYFPGTLDIVLAGTLLSLSSLGTVLICTTTYFFFYDSLEGLRPGTSLSALLTFLTFRATFGFGVNLSGVTLFDEPSIEDYDRGELAYISDEKILMSLGIEDLFGVPRFFALGINGVFSLGVPDKVAIRFPSVVALGIPGVVSFGFPGVFALQVPGKVSIWVPGNVLF